MKIVFLVHYFPPLNSSGARRVLALSKYLSRFGHEVTILTTRKSAYDGPLTEPMPDYCRVIALGGQPRSEDKPSGGEGRRPLLANALVRLRRGLTRVFGQLIDHRIFFALACLRRLPAEGSEAIEAADVLVSSNPPWPVHLAAYLCARRYRKPWVADYRDQFSGSHLFPGNAVSRRVEAWLERRMLHTASAVTVISEPMAEYYRAFHGTVLTIENGYDEELFRDARARIQTAPSDDVTADFRIRYMGTIMPDRIPRNLFLALRTLPVSVRSELRVEFYGKNGMLQTLMQSEFSDLDGVVTLKGEVPYHESLALMMDATALYFVENSSTASLSAKGVLTTKLFEYLAAGRPIVADIAPQTLAGQVIAESGLGLVCSTDPETIAGALRRLVAGDAAVQPNLPYIETFSRESQARRFEKVLEDAVAMKKQGSPADVA